MESACDAAGGMFPLVAAPVSGVPAELKLVLFPAPEPEPEPPEAPAAPAAVESFPCTTAPLSPGLPTRTPTLTFFGLSWLALALAFALPV